MSTNYYPATRPGQLLYIQTQMKRQNEKGEGPASNFRKSLLNSPPPESCGGRSSVSAHNYFDYSERDWLGGVGSAGLQGEIDGSWPGFDE